MQKLYHVQESLPQKIFGGSDCITFTCNQNSIDAVSTKSTASILFSLSIKIPNAKAFGIFTYYLFAFSISAAYLGFG